MSLVLTILPDAEQANAAAADRLASWLTEPDTRRIMLAAGNTPLDLYRRIAERRLPLAHLEAYVLDEYVGVPKDEPRNCAGLIRRTAIEPWGIPASHYHTISSLPDEAGVSVRQHEAKIRDAGGLDVLVLGLGQNGHLGFNEPGSARDSTARVLDLEPISIEANRKWFGGDYAPAQGVTVGLSTILAARRILILAYGPHKTAAVHAMVEGPLGAACPASFLREHPATWVFLDPPAAARLAP